MSVTFRTNNTIIAGWPVDECKVSTIDFPIGGSVIECEFTPAALHNQVQGTKNLWLELEDARALAATILAAVNAAERKQAETRVCPDCGNAGGLGEPCDICGRLDTSTVELDYEAVADRDPLGGDR